MKHYAIIVAGGSGSRMNAPVPKQFLELGGLPVLMHTVKRFFESDDIEIHLVLPPGEIKRWEELRQQYNFLIPVHTCAGGNTRFESVRNGLFNLPEGEGLVAIHDGVRPLVSPDLILNCYDTANRYGSGVAAVSLKDSLRHLHGLGESEAAPREKYRLVQTPQTFRLPEIRDAFASARSNEFTDDASVWEAAGHKVQLVEGEPRNLKLTTPEDLVIAEAILKAYY